MKASRASAPGKLLLIGEYVVLDGAPALVMAVDRRVHVRVGSAVSGRGCLSAPQLGITKAAMQIDAGRLRCDGTDPSALGLTGRLIPGILTALGRKPQDIEAIDIDIDSGELFESGAGRPVKLGLGSSAAVCAALTLGLEDWFARSDHPDSPAERLHRWLPVYRAAMGARASGADLAASFHGGFCRFRSTGETAECRPIPWPEDLYWRAVWTRQAAQTTDFVGAYDAWKKDDPAASAGILARLSEIAHRAGSDDCDGAELFEACRAYANEMAALSDAMQVEIMTAQHRRLADLARRCGVVYKSCGAGGGDLGIALARDPDGLRRFESGVSDRGGVPLNLSLSDAGARLAPSRTPETGEENQ